MLPSGRLFGNEMTVLELIIAILHCQMDGVLACERSCTISSDNWAPRYCKLEESTIDITITRNRINMILISNIYIVHRTLSCHTTVASTSNNGLSKQFYLRLDRISDATSAHSGTIPLRVPFTTNATAQAAISLSSTKSLSSSDCGPTNQ